MFFSEYAQDRFVVGFFAKKRSGFFVDIGAFDGVNLSNTFALEKYYGWNGICVEPSEKFSELVKNRKCICLNCAVLGKNFSASFVYYKNSALQSGIEGFVNEAEAKKQGYNISEKSVFNVKTKTLQSLLEENNAPYFVDYLSLDTEGCEFEILKDFDFSKYKFGVITAEHNKNKKLRKDTYFLLQKNGYFRIAKTCLDDFYISPNLVPAPVLAVRLTPFFARKFFLDAMRILYKISGILKKQLLSSF